MSDDIALTASFPARDEGYCLVPAGLPTPSCAPISVEVEGADQLLVGDPDSAQQALCLTPRDDLIRVTWRLVPRGAPYPQAMFLPRDSRYTRAATALLDEARGFASRGVKAIADHVAAQFTYGHPETRFYDDHDEIPQLCSMAEGSCVDINAYFIAFCRAAGIEAGYVTGCFVPAEKRSHAEDMHCWVVTRTAEGVQEWDIAHHLKLGTGDIRPGLNPKPGRRVALAHSMGLNFPALGLRDVKLIGEPMWRSAVGTWHPSDLTLALDGYEHLPDGT